MQKTVIKGGEECNILYYTQLYRDEVYIYLPIYIYIPAMQYDEVVAPISLDLYI